MWTKREFIIDDMLLVLESFDEMFLILLKKIELAK